VNTKNRANRLGAHTLEIVEDDEAAGWLCCPLAIAEHKQHLRDHVG